MKLAAVDLNLLLVLDALLKDGSVVAAARRLALSPPAASRALGRLRHALADPLFIRTRTGMLPTRRALELRPEVERVIADLERVFGGRDRFSPQTSERVFRFASTDVLQAVLLPALRRRLERDAPSVRIVVEPWRHPQRFDALAEGRLDMVVALADFTVPKHVEETELFFDRLQCMVSRKKNRKRKLGRAEYAAAGHVIVAPHGLPVSSTDERALAEHGIVRRVAMIVPHFAVAALVVAESDLVATVPASAIALWPDIVRGITPRFALAPLRFCLYTHERTTGDEGLAWLKRVLLAVCRKGSAQR